MSDFVGFKDGKVFVDDKYLEAVFLRRPKDKWGVIISLRLPDGEKEEYGIYWCANEEEAKKRLDSFMAQYSNVISIE